MAISPSVPPGAAKLLAFIYETETSSAPPECYEVIYGHKQDKLAKPLTEMTLDEVEAAQPKWTKRFGSSAAGAAQFMRNTLDAPKTLRDLEGEMGLTGDELFEPDLQDRMAFHLLRRRGYDKFIAGKLSRTAFGNNLAKEWASFPVLCDMAGAHGPVTRGDTYYEQDGINKVLTEPEVVEGVLDQVLALDRSRAKSRTTPARDELVAAVQQALRDKGYVMVGRVDGRLGKDTRMAISAYQRENGLPDTGEATGELLAAILAGPMREVAEERAKASPKEIREQVPEVRSTWLGQVWAVILGALGVLWTVIKGVLENLPGAQEIVQPALHVLGDVPPVFYGVIAVAVAGAIWMQMQKGKAGGIAAFRAGARR